MDSYISKIAQLENDILEHEIILRELKIEKTAYENAKRLLNSGSNEENNEENIDEVNEENDSQIDKDESNFMKTGMMFKVRKVLRENERRPYTLKEITKLIGFDSSKATLLGIMIAGEAKKGRCFVRVATGVYGLKEYQHLFKNHDFNQDHENLKSQKGKTKEDVFRPGSRFFRARKILLKNERPMSIKELELACKFTEKDKANFGKNIAGAVMKGKCFCRVGTGIYGLIEHKHLYNV